MTVIKEGPKKIKFTEKEASPDPAAPEAFITWLTGFVEAIESGHPNGHPTQDQWNIIVNKIPQIK